MMNREPWPLYLFRLSLIMAICFFLGMLYWSYVLIEEDLNAIRSTLSEIQRDFKTAKSYRTDPLNTTSVALSVATNTHIDKQLPNLLEADPFYEETLPRMLGPNFKPQGVRKTATVGRPKNLHPFSNWSTVASWHSANTATVATNQFGKYETLAPELAIKMESRERKDKKIPEFWIHLRHDIFWEPLEPSLLPQDVTLSEHFQKAHPVTAADFKFYFDALMNPYVQESGAVAMRNYLGEIEEIEVIDDYTFIVRWKGTEVPQDDGSKVLKIPYIAKQMTGQLKPLPRFLYQYFSDGTKIIEDDSNPETYRINSVWAQNFSEHWARNIIASCGPWVFKKMTDKEVIFERNPNFFNRFAALAQEENVTIRENPDSIWQDFKAGNLDSYNLIPDQLIEWKDFQKSAQYKEQISNGLAVKELEYLSRSYVYIGWNQATPYFSSRKVRQAMTLAIDRKRIIEDILNGLGEQLTGPFAQASPSYNPTIEPWPYNPLEAKKLLEEEGWYDTDGDGIRNKEIEGKQVPFRFALTYYVKNPTTKAIVSYIADALKNVGVACELHGVDISDLSGEFDGKSFDAICLGWALGSPPEEPKQLWHSLGAKEKGSSNSVGFAHDEADAIIEALRFEDNPDRRLKLYHRFHAIIHQEQPYTFLYTPKTKLLYREYLQNVFLPINRQDLIPGANIDQPQPQIFWIKKPETP